MTQLQISLLHVTGLVRLGRMWLGVVLICFTPHALSCQVVAKGAEPFYSEQACLEESAYLAETMIAQGVYAVPNCVEIGQSS